jgi:hypothetical protein
LAIVLDTVPLSIATEFLLNPRGECFVVAHLRREKRRRPENPNAVLASSSIRFILAIWPPTISQHVEVGRGPRIVAIHYERPIQEGTAVPFKILGLHTLAENVFLY